MITSAPLWRRPSGLFGRQTPDRTTTGGMMRSWWLAVLLVAPAACADSTPPRADAGQNDAADGGIDDRGSDSGPSDASQADAQALDADANGLPGDAGADGGADASDPGDFAPYRVLSLNLHCLRIDGTPFANNLDRFSAIAGLVAQEDVRVILAQEVCQRPGEVAQDLLQNALEAATRTGWSHHWVYAHEAWAGTPDAAQEGLAIFVRGELRDGRRVGYRRQGSLQRVLVAARLPAALGNLEVHSVHLDHAAPLTRALQAEETSTYALSSTTTLDLLIAGDFNDRIGSETLLGLSRHGFVHQTSSLGTDEIDHLFVHRGARIATDQARLVFTASHERVSDHPGVLVRVRPAQAPSVQVTRVTAEHQGPGFLTVRGNNLPLRWDRGLVAWPAGPGRWALALTELVAGPFEYKWLINDLSWEVDPNEQGVAGQTHLDQPVFP